MVARRLLEDIRSADELSPDDKAKLIKEYLKNEASGEDADDAVAPKPPAADAPPAPERHDNGHAPRVPPSVPPAPPKPKGSGKPSCRIRRPPSAGSGSS
jgi:hypothetical protein